METPTLRRLAGLSALILFSSIAGCSEVPGKKAPGAGGSCTADPAWISNPSLPLEVPQGKSASDCNIHQYAWAGFIAAVAPRVPGGQPSFEGWMPYYGVFRADGAPPESWGRMPPVPAGSCQDPSLLERTGGRMVHAINKPFTDLTQQAGSVHPLLDQNGKTVYYEMRVNKTLYDFYDSCQMYRAGCVAEGVRPADLYFPNQAVEIKTSWKQLTPTEQASGRFLTIEAVIQEDPKTRHCRIATLGMVGFHFTAATTSHPEMVWASFEQVDNNPLCGDRNKESPPNGKDWSFYDKEECGDDCRVNTYQPGVPAQVCLEYAGGGGSAENVQSVKDLNASVHGLLPKDSIWRNYELIGSIYTKGGEVPPFQFLQSGSLKLSNTTMETYTQTGVVPGVEDNVSCFSCHYFKSNESPIDMSHLVLDHVAPDSGGCPDGKLPRACLNTYYRK